MKPWENNTSGPIVGAARVNGVAASYLPTFDWIKS
jgi:hypothetical protein